MKSKTMCKIGSTALIVAALVNIAPACAESTVGDDNATIGGVEAATVSNAGNNIDDSGTLIAEQPKPVAGERKDLRFRLKVDMNAHPAGFFPDLWPNQNLPVNKHVDKGLVSEITQLKSQVKIPRGAAVVHGGGTLSP